MKQVSMIIGYRVKCYHCGEPARMVMIPAVGDGWRICEDFEGAPDVLTLHDCPKHPSKLRQQS